MKIDDKLLDSLTEQAKASPRLRMNMDLRNSPADTSQRMLNAIEPGSEVPIHRHCTTSETVVVLRGRLIEEFYDELECQCIDAIELSADGPVRALNIPAGQWHTVRVLESGTVIMEVKDGAFKPTAPTDILNISSGSTPSIPSACTSACVSAQSVSPSDSSATCLDSNQKAFSTFIPVSDPRAFDGGDILRQPKKQ